MIGKLAIVAALLIAAPAQPPGNAPLPSPPPPTTAGCLLVSNLFARRATVGNDRTLGERSLYFFIGRIGQQATREQLKLELQQQARLINSSNAMSLMNACIQEMQAKSEMLQSVADQLRQQA